MFTAARVAFACAAVAVAAAHGNDSDEGSCGCSTSRDGVSADSGSCSAPGSSSSSSSSSSSTSRSTAAAAAADSFPSHPGGPPRGVPSPPRDLAHLKDLVLIPAGTSTVGGDEKHFPADAEGPPFPFTLKADMFMDKYEVSNIRFAEFVIDTSYKTEAELFGWSFVHEDAVPPSISAGINQSVAGIEWWLPVPNATWSSPEGLGTTVADRMDHPALHVSKRDADAFCKWAGGRLPSESEWEHAARGGKKGRIYPWGNKKTIGEEGVDKSTGGLPHRMNIWQGKFPNTNTGSDGYVWAAPVDAYGPQNGWGLHNILGNVWEWTSDTWCPNVRPDGKSEAVAPRGAKPGERSLPPDCARLSPVQRRKMAEDPGEIDFVKKGGSFMCHRDFCFRYRVAARHKNTANSSAYNLGFRCVYDTLPPWAKMPQSPASSSSSSEGAGGGGDGGGGGKDGKDEL